MDSYGYLLKKIPILYPNKYDHYNIMIAIGLTIIAIGLIIYTRPPVPFSTTTIKGAIGGYLSSVSGVLAILMWCKCINYIPIISYFGRYSIIVLCTHHLVYRPISLCLSEIISNDLIISWIVFIGTMGVIYFIIPLCIKFLPYVTAQKNIFDSNIISAK